MLRKINLILAILLIFSLIDGIYALEINDPENKIDSSSENSLEKIFNNENYVLKLIEENSTKIKIEEGATWVAVRIYLKSSPEFTITDSMNLNRSERSEFIEKRNVYFKELINNLIDNISGDYIQFIQTSPESFTAWLNEQGLVIVLNNKNVERIDYSVSGITYVPYIGLLKSKGDVFILCILSFLIFIFLLILLIKLIRKCKKYDKKS